MKRKISVFLCILLLFCTMAPAASALSGEALRAADTLQTLGLVNGDLSGDYRLSAPASRAHAAVLLVRLSGSQAAAQADHRSAGFRDMPAWAAREISYAVRQGWITGVTAQSFQPDRTVTANAWFTMLLRMLGYRDKSGDFTVEDAALFARQIGLTPGVYEGLLTRGDLFTSMVQALSFPYRDGSGTVLEHLLDAGVCPRYAAGALGLLTPELTARQVADRHLSAVFCLETYTDREHWEEQDPTGNASGFFLTTDGLAATNYHSIDGAIAANAILVTGEVFPVESVIWYDKEIDLAILRISRTSTRQKTVSTFSTLNVVGKTDLCAGDTVYALGNPLGLGLAVSSGVVSAVSRDVDRYALPCIMNSADISQGSSGGALLNVYGQVVAVTSGAYVYGNNLYLAVPADPLLTADRTAKGLTLTEVAQKEAPEEDAEASVPEEET